MQRIVLMVVSDLGFACLEALVLGFISFTPGGGGSSRDGSVGITYLLLSVSVALLA